MTMKAFTDISQGKKLAEILPMESADMYLDYDFLKHEVYAMIMDDQFDDTCIRAWSLAALLDALPSSTLDSSNDHYYRSYCMERFTEWHDNAVDACYEMIIKLHEQKLL